MSVSRDTSYNLAAALAPALFGLVVTPFYLRAIGPDRYGILAISWTIVSALGFASLGMGPAVSNRLARMDVRSIEMRSSLVWNALIVALVLSLVGSVCVFAIGAIYFRQFLRPPTALAAEVSDALPLLAALLPFSIAIGVMNGALQGCRRFAAMSALGIGTSAGLTILPLIVSLLVNGRLPALIAMSLVTYAVVAILQLCVCAKVVPLRAPTLPDLPTTKALISYGSWMSVTALVAPLVMLIDRFFIGALRGPTAVAIYVLPYNLVQQLVLVPASLSNAIMPRLASLPDEQVQELQSSTIAWMNGFLTPLSVIALALARPFLSTWVGPVLGSRAGPVAIILLVGAWIHGIGHVPSTILIARNRPDLLTKLLLSYLMPYIALLYVATLHFGIIGAAATWTLRAAFDPVLFLYTRPRRSDLLPLASSAALVLCAMGAALLLAWTSVSYWVLMTLLSIAACYQNRAVLIWWTGEIRKVAFKAN